ncbi:hypothetical protein ACJX0J_041583, partial [Zea mays]
PVTGHTILKLTNIANNPLLVQHNVTAILFHRFKYIDNIEMKNVSFLWLGSIGEVNMHDWTFSKIMVISYSNSFFFMFLNYSNIIFGMAKKIMQTNLFCIITEFITIRECIITDTLQDHHIFVNSSLGMNSNTTELENHKAECLPH